MLALLSEVGCLKPGLVNLKGELSDIDGNLELSWVLSFFLYCVPPLSFIVGFPRLPPLSFGFLFILEGCLNPCKVFLVSFDVFIV